MDFRSALKANEDISEQREHPSLEHKLASAPEGKVLLDLRALCQMALCMGTLKSFLGCRMDTATMDLCPFISTP